MVNKELEQLPKLENGELPQYLQFLELNRLFFIDEVRKWLNLLLREEISMSKFVENFNVKHFKHSATQSSTVKELEREVERLKELAIGMFRYTPRYNACGSPATQIDEIRKFKTENNL